MKRIALAGLAAGIAMTLSLVAHAQDTVKFGVAAEPYPPLSSKDTSGTWVGWEIDFMNEVCAQAQMNCELVEVAWDGIIPALLEKKIDVIWSSMTITDERKEVIDFTQFYYDAPTVMIGAKADATVIDFANADSLAGKAIGVQTSTIHANFAEKFFGGAADIKIYDTLDNALADLAAGRVDYIQEGKSSLTPFLNEERGADFEIKAYCPQDATLGYGVGGGVRKEDTALRDQISAAILEVVASGKWAELVAKYPDLKDNMIGPEVTN